MHNKRLVEDGWGSNKGVEPIFDQYMKSVDLWEEMFAQLVH